MRTWLALGIGIAAASLSAGCATAWVGGSCASDRPVADTCQRAKGPEREDPSGSCGAWLAGALVLDLLTLPLQEAWVERMERERLLVLRREESAEVWTPVPDPPLDGGESEQPSSSRWSLDLAPSRSTDGLPWIVYRR